MNTWLVNGVDFGELQKELNELTKSIQEGHAKMSVTPGEAHLSAVAEYCTETGIPVEQCFHCLGEDREPDTMPTAFPAAPAAPEICPEQYYGISCHDKGCKETHRLPRKRNT